VVGSQQYEGAKEIALADHFNGSSWRRVPTARASDYDVFSAVAAVDVSHAWAVGSSVGPRPLIERWDGAAWSVTGSAALVGTPWLAGVSADAIDDVWAVGPESGLGESLVEHWDGVFWTLVHGAPLGLSGVVALSPTAVWAVGSTYDAATEREAALAAHWDGVSWTTVGLPDAADRETNTG
jgi:hypothetical protein